MMRRLVRAMVWLEERFLYLATGTLGAMFPAWLLEFAGIFSMRFREIAVSKYASRSQVDRAFAMALRISDRRIVRARRIWSYHRLTSEDLARPRLVALSGFFYSGSGAVVDFLRGIRKSKKWGPAGEVCILKYPGGFADLLKRLRSNKILAKSDLLDLWFHVTGLFPAARTRSRKLMLQTNRQGGKNTYYPESAVYRAILLECFLKLSKHAQSNTLNESVFVELVKNYLDRALRSSAVVLSKDLLILDQIVTAWRLDISCLIKPLAIIMVHRDPRDQFVDANLGHKRMGRPQWTAEQFVHIYRTRREYVEELAPQVEREYGHSIVRVAFEDFVCNFDRESKRILSHTGLMDLVLDPKRCRFKPSQSIKNVGKHRFVVSEAQMQVLDDQLSQYYYPEVSSKV